MPRRLNAASPQRTGRVRIDGSAPARVVGYTSYPHRTLRRGDSTVPEVKIAAEARTEFGKGAARRSRREGKVPAVLYGHGTDTRHLTLPGHALMLALKTPNVLLRLEGLQRGADLALPKSVQRDPVRGFLEHVDLILVRSGEKVTVEVPIRVTGEIAPGDSLLNQQIVQIPVEADATNIPQGIDVDVEGMDIGDAVHASDLKLPPGVTLQVEPDTLVLHVIAQQAAEEPEAAEGEGEGEVPESVDSVADESRDGEEESAG
jgi:large subunit ribosomal protein L25